MVGDDAQAIYDFRAATCATFSTSRPSSIPRHRHNASRKLSAPPTLLSASNAVIGLAPERFTKNRDRKTDGAEARFDLGRRRCGARSTSLSRPYCRTGKPDRAQEQAVSVRTSHHSAMLEIELSRRNIPSSNSVA